MQLIQIDAVDLQAPQAAIQRRLQVFPVEARPAFTDVVNPALAGACRLAGEDDLVAVAGLFQPVSDDLLGAPIGFRARRNGIEFRRVEEIHALRQRVIHLFEGLGPGVLLPPGHGTQADDADFDIGVAEFAILHESCPR